MRVVIMNDDGDRIKEIDTREAIHMDTICALADKLKLTHEHCMPGGNDTDDMTVFECEGCGEDHTVTWECPDCGQELFASPHLKPCGNVPEKSLYYRDKVHDRIKHSQRLLWNVNLSSEWDNIPTNERYDMFSVLTQALEYAMPIVHKAAKFAGNIKEEGIFEGLIEEAQELLNMIDKE